MPDRIFLIVSGGLMDVVDNSSHFDDPYTLKKNMSLIQILQLEISMVNLGIKKHLKVNRILECGKNVKCDNAPVYANMGYGNFQVLELLMIKKDFIL